MSRRPLLALVTAAVALFVLALAATPAFAQRQAANAKAFAKKHGLPVRTIKVGPAGRKVNRLFVPVTADKFDEFTETMTTGSDGLLGRYSADHSGHIALALKPGDVYLWARNYGVGSPRGDYRGMYWNATTDGYLLAINPTDIGHLKGWLAAREGDALFCQGNCMEWIGNAETGPGGLMLFHDLGIKRSKDGNNMKAKLLHGANARLEAVGVIVRDVATFEAKTDADLLGRPPASGIEDSVR